MNKASIAIEAVSKVTKLSKSAILSPCRKDELVEARQLVILLLMGEGMTDEHIGLAINRGRVTTLHARRTALIYLEVSKPFNLKYQKTKAVYDTIKPLLLSEDR